MSRNFYLAKFHFLPFQNVPKIIFWNWKKFKTAKNAISRVFLPGLLLNFLAHCVSYSFLAGLLQCCVLIVCQSNWLLLSIHELAISKGNFRKNALYCGIKSEVRMWKRTSRTAFAVCHSSLYCCWSKFFFICIYLFNSAFCILTSRMIHSCFCSK